MWAEGDHGSEDRAARKILVRAAPGYNGIDWGSDWGTSGGSTEGARGTIARGAVNPPRRGEG